MNRKTSRLLIALALLAGAAHADVRSCGPGCYTDSPKRGGGKVKLAKIGSYTAVEVRRERAPEAAPEVAAAPAAQPATRQVAARVPVAPRRSVPVAAANPVPAVAAAPATVPQRLNPQRANTRRTILEQELNNERNALAAAQKALAEGRAVNKQSDAGHQARVRQLQSAVFDREQNIQALQRELGRM